MIDNGKPLTIAKAADVALTADLFHYMSGWATKIEGHTIPISAVTSPGSEFLAYTRKEPVGVVGQIIPWNFPSLRLVGDQDTEMISPVRERPHQPIQNLTRPS